MAAEEAPGPPQVFQARGICNAATSPAAGIAPAAPAPSQHPAAPPPPPPTKRLRNRLLARSLPCLQGMSFYVQMDPRIDEDADFVAAARTTGTALVKAIIGACREMGWCLPPQA